MIWALTAISITFALIAQVFAFRAIRASKAVAELARTAAREASEAAAYARMTASPRSDFCTKVCALTVNAQGSALPDYFRSQRQGS